MDLGDSEMGQLFVVRASQAGKTIPSHQSIQIVLHDHAGRRKEAARSPLAVRARGWRNGWRDRTMYHNSSRTAALQVSTKRS
jgi:uncharacterized protein YjlB